MNFHKHSSTAITSCKPTINDLPFYNTRFMLGIIPILSVILLRRHSECVIDTVMFDIKLVLWIIYQSLFLCLVLITMFLMVSIQLFLNSYFIFRGGGVPVANGQLLWARNELSSLYLFSWSTTEARTLWSRKHLLTFQLFYDLPIAKIIRWRSETFGIASRKASPTSIQQCFWSFLTSEPVYTLPWPQGRHGTWESRKIE